LDHAIEIARASLEPDNTDQFCLALLEEKSTMCMKYWEIIADNLKKAGWSWRCVSAAPLPSVLFAV
jgi:hypothetical protein